MSEEFSINRIITLLLPKWPIILISSIIFGIGAFLISTFLIQPTYVASGTLYVTGEVMTFVATPEQEDTTLSDVVLSQELAKTYGHILSSNTFFKGVAENSRTGYNFRQLQAMTSISNVEETGILTVNVSNPNPKVAADVVNAILELAPEEIARVVVAGSAVTIDKAEIPAAPSSPDIPKNTLIGILLGFVCAVGIIFLIDLLDDTMKRTEEVERVFGFPVLGMIPYVDTRSKTQSSSSYSSYATATN